MILIMNFILKHKLYKDAKRYPLIYKHIVFVFFDVLQIEKNNVLKAIET